MNVVLPKVKLSAPQMPLKIDGIFDEDAAQRTVRKSSSLKPKFPYSQNKKYRNQRKLQSFFEVFPQSNSTQVLGQ